MRAKVRLLIVAAMVAVGVTALGCRSEPTGSPKTGEKKEHDHPDKGPHDGLLIELGDEEYHGEYLRDREKKQVTVYLLDGKGKDAVPIEEKELRLKLSSLAPVVVVSLTAQPQESDPKGKSSRFVGTHEQLGTEKKLKGELEVKIGGKNYFGPLNEAAKPHKH